MNLFDYHRRESCEVHIGATPLGGENPIRVQSMTNTSTLDTEACVKQILRIAEAGGDYVRLTTQGVREAENLREINAGVRATGCMVPLVADVHFNPKVAEVAALYAEKVRINPGNYVDAARTFKHIEYTEEEYAREIEKIKARLIPLLHICRENGTAIRIGVNHGSLSDRIMSRYGDTPEGIVESCMEFLRICVEEDFREVVVSIKASNTAVMVRSVRLLVRAMEKEGMDFPLHLGVTEAGDGEDGRIKSAVGIGALLADGIGDTVRVSLSEAPEAEIPVARKLVNYIAGREGAMMIPALEAADFNYLNPVRRKTQAVRNIGGDLVPVVVADRMDLASDGRLKDFSAHPDFRPDYIYCGRNLPPVEEREGAYIVDADMWTGEENTYPAFPYNMLPFLSQCPADLKFLFLTYGALNEEVRACLKYHPEVVVISQSGHANRLGEHRALIHELTREGLRNPVIIFQQYAHGQEEKEDFQIESAADMGALLFDGLCDGLYLYNQGALDHRDIDATAFTILQAARLRTTKTEYIACPGCGRTLYDLQDTLARIKSATAHLKGLKIAVMGCIVNGPGEMADADYGYVGAARGKVSLYKKKVCVERNIPAEEAVERLLRLIRENGDDPNYVS
ncbi:MAG: 4-hydroxy-3-methylbut-2-en-1-yl diphosphate synthase [Paraprevotella sp.]|nr:4-hydroxy-3-methylbut-2-en-1-yl diphosphate synthase [Paraprevotella sp.]